MDGTSTLAEMMPQGVPAPNSGNGLDNQANSMAAPASIADSPSNNPATDPTSYAPNSLNILGGADGMAGVNNLNALGGAAGVAGMDNLNSLGGVPGMNNNLMAGMNPNELNSVMNAVLMNNSLQQQQAAGMGGVMNNPLLLQTMMNQGMMGNSFAPQMGGMENLLQQGMMNPGMMGMMGGMGMPNLNAMGGLDGSANKPPQMDNSNQMLAQLMQNPMAMQMMAQGMNPMMLLGGMGGAMGQNQFGLGGANLLGSLGSGMSGLGTSLPPGIGNNPIGVSGADVASSGLNGMLPNSTLADGMTAPHPNALFAFNNPVVPQDSIPNAIGDGVLDHSTMVKGKKHGKKAKVKGKPKRPLSAYNFFFREERSRILDSLANKKNKVEEEKKESDDDKENEGDDSKSTEKVEDPKTEKEYDQIGNDGKKIPHGKIGFENLAKLIGKRWRELDADDNEKYRKLADEDMTRYKKAMEAFLMKEAQTGVDGDLISPALYNMPNQKRKMDDGDGLAKKKKPKKMMDSRGDIMLSVL